MKNIKNRTTKPDKKTKRLTLKQIEGSLLKRRKISGRIFLLESVTGMKRSATFSSSALKKRGYRSRVMNKKTKYGQKYFAVYVNKD